MMMVTMEIPTTFHPQMEKISDSIGSTTGSTTTTIITQINNNQLTTTFTSSSSNRIIINYLVLILVLTLFLTNFDLNLVMISDVFLASMPT